MEQLKEWAKKHKALAIGGGIAIVVLLYLWLRSGSSANNSGASSNSALSSYYAAEAASTQGAAEQVAAQDQLQAEENATNTQGSVYTAEIAAQKAPVQAQLDALTTLANLQAYQDYLGASSGSQTNSSAGTTQSFVVTPLLEDATVQNEYYAGSYPLPGQPASTTSGTFFTTPNSIAGYNVGNISSIPGFKAIGTGSIPANLTSGNAPPPPGADITYVTTPGTTTTTPNPPPVQPGQFNGFAMPVL